MTSQVIVVFIPMFDSFRLRDDVQVVHIDAFQGNRFGVVLSARCSLFLTPREIFSILSPAIRKSLMEKGFKGKMPKEFDDSVSFHSCNQGCRKECFKNASELNIISDFPSANNDNRRFVDIIEENPIVVIYYKF